MIEPNIPTSPPTAKRTTAVLNEIDEGLTSGAKFVNNVPFV
jgi:hypothetical protein